MKKLSKDLKHLLQKSFKILVILLLLCSQLISSLSPIYAASSPWTQSNWAGGSGQVNWSDSTKFDNSSNLVTTTPNQLTLNLSSEKFSNTGFETDLTSWNGANASLTSSMQAYWKLDEASGSRSDSFGSNTLSDNNTVTQSPGKLGSAAQFVNANNEYLSINDNAALSTGDIDFTVSGWVYFDSIINFAEIVAKHTSSPIREYALYPSGGNKIAFSIYNSAGTQVGVVSSSSNITTSTWYYFVAWHDSVANTVNIQLNNGTTASAATTGVPADTGATFFLGRPGTSHDGRIDGVGFWKRTLTAPERTALYNAGNGFDYPFITSTRDIATTYLSSAGSAKLVTPSSSAGEFTQSVNVGDTGTYYLSTYAYTDGSAITSSDLELFYNGSTVTTTYDSVGNGWYKLSGSVTGANASRQYGVQVKANKTVYVDDFSLNTTPAPVTSGTLTSSVFDSGERSDWSTLTFSATTPANTTATVKVRTGNQSDLSDATAFGSCPAISSGSTVGGTTCAPNAARYAQYLITLSTSDSLVTPTFTNFSLPFSPAAATVGLAASASNTQPSLGESVNFAVTATGGTAPYTYCWDFDAPVTSGTAKPATFNNTLRVPCYSTQQNPSYAFNAYGQYDVWVYVTDSALETQKSLLKITVSVGGPTVLATASGPTGPALVGDGVTDNGVNFANWANFNVDGNITVEFPSGTYRFKSRNTLTTFYGLNAIELRPQEGAQVTLLFDPDNTDPPDMKTFLSNSPPPNVVDIYIHNMSIIRDLDGGTMSQKDRARAFYTSPDASIGYNWVIENVTFNNWALLFDDVRKPLLRRINVGEQGPGLSYVTNIVIDTTSSGVTAYSGSTLYSHINIVTPGSLTITTAGGGESFTDNGDGTLTGSLGGAGTINYSTSAWSLTYNSDPGASHSILGSWKGVEIRDSVATLPGYFTQIYYKSSQAHEQFYYDSTSSVGYSITRDSYIDHANGYNNILAHMQYGNIGVWNNYLAHPRDNAVFQGWGSGENIDIESNYIDGQASGGGSSGFMATDGNLDITIASNIIINMENESTFQIANGGTNIKIQNNTFGLDAHTGTGNLYDFHNGCTPAEYTDTCNAVNTCASLSGNVCDETPISISDPGQYEFTSPTNTSISIAAGSSTTTSQTVALTLSAIDAGSGMGTTARFPYTDGALMQLSNDGSTWSEVRDYSSSSNWTLSDGYGTKTVYVRFADVDHNWTTPVSSSITYSAATTTTSNSTATSTSTGPSVCTNTQPGPSTPWLYGAIPQDNQSILLYFTQVKDNVDHYALEFGTKPGIYQYGLENIGNSDIYTYLVTFIKPNTTYYFRIRAGNGCATGQWSNEFSSSTSILNLNQSITTQLTPEVTIPVSSQENKELNLNVAPEQKNPPNTYILITAGLVGLTTIILTITLLRFIHHRSRESNKN